MLLDIIITSITVQRLNHQFKRLSELGDRVREARNALGNAVTGGAIGAAEAIDDLDLQKKLQEAQKTDVYKRQGFYTSALYEKAKAKNGSVSGVDISKFAVKAAAGKYKGIDFAVASLFHLPCAEMCTRDRCRRVRLYRAEKAYRPILKPAYRCGRCP